VRDLEPIAIILGEHSADSSADDILVLHDEGTAMRSNEYGIDLRRFQNRDIAIGSG
jgi:hypothetical protein